MTIIARNELGRRKLVFSSQCLVMSGYRRGNARQRGVAALSPPTPRPEVYEFGSSNFERAAPPPMPAQSSGSQSSDYERISLPSVYSELEPRESPIDGLAKEEFDRRRAVEASVDWAPSRERSSDDVNWAPAPPLTHDASTQTHALPGLTSDQVFAGLIPYQATELLKIGRHSYALVGIFVVLLMIFWRFMMNRGSHYYVRLEIGGFGID